MSVPPLPLSYQDENDDWIYSDSTGDWILTEKAEERLKREIRIEHRQSYDEFRKWAAVIIACTAFAVALISLRKKDREPDPCPKNYYRSDSGECVFALQKTETSRPQPQIVPPPPSSSPKKQ